MEYIKYIAAIITGFIGYHVFKFIVMKYVIAVTNANSEDILVHGMFIMAGLIIGCTVLIMVTIKEYSNK